MVRKIEQYHPNQILHSSAAARLPDKLRNFLRIALVGVAWYGLLSSCLSIITSLEWVLHVARWLWEHAGVLKPLLLRGAEILHEVVELWRAITAPIHRLLFGWLPFRVPRMVIDTLVILSILWGGYVRAWFATKLERRLMRVFNNNLTMEGRIAVVKWLSAAAFILKGEYSDKEKDKAQRELEMALDEMTKGISDDDFAFLETLFDMDKDEFHDVLMECALSQEKALAIRRSIFGKSAIVAMTLAFCLFIDAAYVYWVN